MMAKKYSLNTYGIKGYNGLVIKRMELRPNERLGDGAEHRHYITWAPKTAKLDMEKIHQQNHPEVLISAGDTDWQRIKYFKPLESIFGKIIAVFELIIGVVLEV
jgi:hypothetical protein